MSNYIMTGTDNWVCTDEYRKYKPYHHSVVWENIVTNEKQTEHYLLSNGTFQICQVNDFKAIPVNKAV